MPETARHQPWLGRGKRKGTSGLERVPGGKTHGPARRLVPDHKTIAVFRRQNRPTNRKTCAKFVDLCRRIGVLKGEVVAVDGSKFKAVNNRDRNFIKGKIASRLHLEAELGRYRGGRPN